MGIVNGKPVYHIGGGKSNFGGEIRQMMPAYMTDGENSVERFLANMDYACVSGAVITQEYIDGNQDGYLLECRSDRIKICALYEEKPLGDISGFDGIKLCAGRLADKNLLNHTHPFEVADKNGKILVGNKVAYDLMITPREVEEFDTLGLAQVLDVDPELIRSKMAEYRRFRKKIGWQTVVMIKQIPQEAYMRFAEVAYRFPGFRGQARSIREYPFNAGGNLLGYVSEVNEMDNDDLPD